MSFWSWITEIYAGKEPWIAILAVAAGLLIIAASVSYALRTTGVFAALAAIVGGVVTILSVFGNVGAQAGFVGFAMLFMLGGATYLALFGSLTARRIILERKRHRTEIARRLCYTLPDRENTYVRARLNTALQIPNKELNEYMGGVELKEKPMKLEYARKLLNRVKEAPLSKAERLQIEEMGKAFSLYLSKGSWTAEDLRAVNELCAALLKLSAKYAV